jgi:hypothetical protein
MPSAKLFGPLNFNPNTEAEYIAMSMALPDVIPIMELLEEMQTTIFLGYIGLQIIRPRLGPLQKMSFSCPQLMLKSQSSKQSDSLIYLQNANMYCSA